MACCITREPIAARREERSTSPPAACRFREISREVPRETFVELFRRAINPPQDLLRLPFTSQQEQEAYTWLSLLLRPTVCPEVTRVL